MGTRLSVTSKILLVSCWGRELFTACWHVWSRTAWCKPCPLKIGAAPIASPALVLRHCVSDYSQLQPWLPLDCDVSESLQHEDDVATYVRRVGRIPVLVARAL